MSVFYEVPSGEAVEVKPFHMATTGITQHGKTEVLKSLIEWFRDKGFTVLVIDVKDKTLGDPDFAEYPHIPIYMEEVAEPLPLLGLLESDAKMQLKFQFPELIKACQRSRTLVEIRDRLQAVVEGGKIHPVRKDKAEVLLLLINRLIEEIQRVPVSGRLELQKGRINVIGLANQGFSEAYKQIVVRAVIHEVRSKYSNVVTFFDEAHIQIPEGYGSASKDWIKRTIKEGASSKQFLVIADQTLKDVDKDVITQCPIKIFGGQTGGRLEAERTVQYIPVRGDLKAEDVMTLKLGHFYLSTREWTKLVYARPTWLSPDNAQRIATGEIEPDDPEIQNFRTLARAFSEELSQVIHEVETYGEAKTFGEDVSNGYEERLRSLGELVVGVWPR